YSMPTISPIPVQRENFLYSRLINSTIPIETSARIPTGRVTVANEAKQAASIHRSLRTAKNDANNKAMNSGSEPPRYDRCIQSQFRTANRPAIHPPQSL